MSSMTALGPLSARLNAAFDGCYEARRASVLSGVPQLMVYLWARDGLVRERFRDAVEFESSLAA